jgi:menaquinone-dependent protoporphyrinogen oxidase
MSHVLVAYASKHGATTEIAEAVAAELRQAGHEVDCLSAERVSSIDAYDAAVIGSAVYMKRWLPEARRLLKRHAKELADRPFWVFSSGPFGEKPDPSWSEPPRTIKRAEDLGVRDHVVFGGRLPLEPSNFMERAMVRDCPPDKRDLRDWDAIRAWVAEIGMELSASVTSHTDSSLH